MLIGSKHWETPLDKKCQSSEESIQGKNEHYHVKRQWTLDRDEQD